MATQPTLLDLCEPVFQYVCRLNRLGRKAGGSGLDAGQVRADLRSLINDARTQAERAGVRSQFEKVELPLVYFADFMVRDSRLPFASSWRDIAAGDYKKIAGDDDFYVELDETMQDNSDAATQRLAVFYTALGLGFTGALAGQTQELKRRQSEIGARLRGQMDVPPGGKICPQAYENVDTATLVVGPASSIAWIVVTLGLLLAVVLGAYVWLYFDAVGSLGRSVDSIISSAASPAQQGGRS
jgi:type VI protein secretion system component VasF